jgi:hypothetical protein
LLKIMESGACANAAELANRKSKNTEIRFFIFN